MVACAPTVLGLSASMLKMIFVFSNSSGVAKGLSLILAPSCDISKNVKYSKYTD